MNKTIFLDKLRRELAILPQAEIDEAVAYYADYIEDAGEENEEQVIAELGDPTVIAAQICKEQTVAPIKKDYTMSLAARVLLIILHILIGIPILGSLVLTAGCLIMSGGCMVLAGLFGVPLILFGFSVHTATAVMWTGVCILIAAIGVLLGLSCIYALKWLCKILVRSTTYVFGRDIQ